MENYVLRRWRVWFLVVPFPPSGLPFFVGLFACLDFGSCPLFPLNLKTTNADFCFPQPISKQFT